MWWNWFKSTFKELHGSNWNTLIDDIQDLTEAGRCQVAEHAVEGPKMPSCDLWSEVGTGQYIEIRVSSHLSCHRTTCFAVASYWFLLKAKVQLFKRWTCEIAKLHFRIFRIFSTLEKCRPCLSFVTLTSWFASEMTRWQDWVAKSSTLSHDVPNLMDHGDKTRELGELL